MKELFSTGQWILVGMIVVGLGMIGWANDGLNGLLWNAGVGLVSVALGRLFWKEPK